MSINSYEYQVLNLSNRRQYSYDTYLLRAILGLVTEHAEFIEKPSLDELGDCLFWYTAIGLCYPTQSSSQYHGEFDTLKLMEAGEKLTRVKSQKISEEKEMKMINQIETQLYLFYNSVILPYLKQNSCSVSDLQLLNVTKLNSRYEHHLC
jgi:hypothetical protein